jgi:hypothetical protein
MESLLKSKVNKKMNTLYLNKNLLFIEVVKSYLFTNKKNSKIELNDDEFIKTRPGKIKDIFINELVY